MCGRLKQDLLLIALLVSVACTGPDAPSPTSVPATSPQPPTASVTLTEESSPDGSSDRTLLYLDGKTLRTYDIDDGSSRTIAELPSSDATASGGSVVYVTSATPTTGDEDFIASPELHLYDVSSGRDVTIGPGNSVLWHPQGGRFAYLEPAEPRRCEGEVCEGSNALIAAEIGSRRRTTLSRGEVYAPLAWLGARVVMSRDTPSPTTVAISESGASEDLGVPPAELWGASPDGAWVVRSVPARVDFEAVRPGGEEITVEMPGSVLGEGAWAPDSTRLAAVSLRESGASRLVLLDPSESGFETLPAARGVAGPVLWAPDGRALAFTRATGPDGLKVQAVICEASDGEFDCRGAFSWGRGVTLLSLD